MGNKASKIIEIISRDDHPSPNTRKARINPAWDGTLRPSVIFDGETSATTKGYTYLNSYTPAPGDVVAMVRHGHSWIILGKIVNS
jgi:hypothetical protein